MTPDPALPLFSALSAERRGLMRMVHAQLSWLGAIGAGLVGALVVAAGAATCESPLYHRVTGGLVLLAAGGLLVLVAALTRGRALGLCESVAALDAAAEAGRGELAPPTLTAPLAPQAPRLRAAVRHATMAFLLAGLLLALGGVAYSQYADALYDAQCTSADAQSTQRYIHRL
ncbi:MAG: hypothetical protein HY423_06720 [Candidatus Lambdaproteobacteria bacterium]|nr:hypothetical protein [Candidatus Lambdaproteobacteria bacterium]